MTPLLAIKRMQQPTTRLTDTIQRVDRRNTAYGLAARGEYGAAVQSAVANCLPEKYPLSAAQKAVIDHLASMPAVTAADPAPIPRDPAILTRHIKALGSFLKCDQVAACQVPTFAYYSHTKQGEPIQPKFPNAILIVMRKEWRAVRASSGRDWMGDPISFQAYQHLALVAETMANYLRRLGYQALPQYGPSFLDNYIVMLPPLLLMAGVGEVSRAGIILNPYLGLAYKAAAILTDMPLEFDAPIDFGLQRFCQACKLCASACPSKAIPSGDRVLYNGYETWKLDVRRCASFNFTNKHGTMCNRCVKACPWSAPPTRLHNLVRQMVLRWRFTRSLAILGAQRFDFGKSSPDEKWWFDMEYVNGVIQAPG